MTIRNRLRHALPAAALVLALLVGLFTGTAAASDTASDVTFTFTDSGVTVSDDSTEGYQISGTDLTISAAGTYTVTGSCADGTITVKKGTAGVTLILSDLTLRSTTSAPLSCNKETEVTLVVTGTNTLTRAQAAAILMRYASYKGADTAARGVLSFPDAGDVPDWAHDAMQWCVAEGLLQGTDTEDLLPGGTATRAQIATIMTRYLAA